MEMFDRLDAGSVGEADAIAALAWKRRTRSRQRVALADGSALMLVLPRGTVTG